MRRYNGSRNDHDVPYAMAVDGSANVYVTGEINGLGIDADYATIKYDSSGNEAWVRRYNSVNYYDVAYDIALDGIGNVYVTGGSVGSGTATDYATIKYDPSGNEIWVKRYDGPKKWYDEAYAVAVDGSGSVYVTGESYGSGTGEDYATIKYIQFLRGDCDKDGNISLVDVILLSNYILKGGPAPNPLQPGDVNCDGKYDLVDVVLLARYVLLGNPFPC